MIESGILMYSWALWYHPSYLLSGCRLLSTGHEASQCLACEADHENEGALLEDVSRLLGDVRASVRCASVCPPCPACTESSWQEQDYPSADGEQ